MAWITVTLMLCPSCKVLWNVHGCSLCGECGACLNTIDVPVEQHGVSVGAAKLHRCLYDPHVLSENAMRMKHAEGTRV